MYLDALRECKTRLRVISEEKKRNRVLFDPVMKVGEMYDGASSGGEIFLPPSSTPQNSATPTPL
jgi:hypothetical protein